VRVLRADSVAPACLWRCARYACNPAGRRAGMCHMPHGADVRGVLWGSHGGLMVGGQASGSWGAARQTGKLPGAGG
jgi:hypothetical protein